MYKASVYSRVLASTIIISALMHVCLYVFVAGNEMGLIQLLFMLLCVLVYHIPYNHCIVSRYKFSGHLYKQPLRGKAPAANIALSRPVACACALYVHYITVLNPLRCSQHAQLLPSRVDVTRRLLQYHVP